MLLREAIEADVPAIIEIEHAPEFREFIGRRTSEEHTAAMLDPDMRYFIAMLTKWLGT